MAKVTPISVKRCERKLSVLQSADFRHVFLIIVDDVNYGAKAENCLKSSLCARCNNINTILVVFLLSLLSMDTEN